MLYIPYPLEHKRYCGLGMDALDIVASRSFKGFWHLGLDNLEEDRKVL